MDNIWKKDDEYYKLEPITDDIVKEAEKTLKVNLPQSYINILKEQNGGYISFNSYPTKVPTSWVDDHINVNYILGIGKEKGVLESDYLIKEWSLPKGLILFSGDGHTWLAMDYRDTVADPSIVYVDSESQQVIKIADSFKEFLDHLYIEEAEILQDYDFSINDCNEQDLETFIKQDNIEGIMIALTNLSQGDTDMEWFGNQLIKLSNHPSEDVRNEVAQNVWNFLTYRLGEKILDKLIINFEQDPDADVRMFAELIKEKMDYSFEQLKQDLKTQGMISISYQDKIYHINKHTNQWHLSDYQADLQSFDSAELLLEKARIDEKSLKEIWSDVKKV